VPIKNSTTKIQPSQRRELSGSCRIFSLRWGAIGA
jgi:hypothetical protein